MRQSRIARILKSKSGASLIMVLAVMLLLLAVGTSVLVAATASVGAGQSRYVYNQLNLYAESLHKTLKYSLENGTDGLGEQMLYIMNDNAGGIVNISNVSVELDGGTRLSGIYSIGISIQPNVTVIDAVDPVSDEDGVIIIEGEPRYVYISAQITITVLVEYKGKSMVSVAEYNFSGGALSDGDITNSGRWEFLSYDKSDV